MTSTADRTSSKPLRILSVALGDPADFVEGETVLRLRSAGAECDQLVLPYRKRWIRLFDAAWAARHIGKYDVVITNEYNNAFIFTLMGRLLAKNIKSIAVGLNLSGRPLKFGIKLLDAAIDRVFQCLSMVIVHSKEEIDLFARLHNISRENFKFSTWGFDAPQLNGPTENFNAESSPYFCMVGRNNRDFGTFVSALETADADGVIVCGKDERLDIKQTARVRVFRDLSMAECAVCVYYSFGNVVLVKDANRGAGHITAVMGMLYGKPHIFTDVPTLQDYLVPNQHGIGVRLGDAAAVAGSMTALLQNSALANQFGQNGQRDAQMLHSHKAAQDRVSSMIIQEIGL